NIFIFLIIFISSCAITGTGENIQKAKAYYQLGLSYLNDNNIQPAFVEFQKALELDPNNKEILNMIGIIYLLNLENYPEAIKYFQRALRIDKNFSEASNNLGIAYEKAGRFNEAIESYKIALSNPLYRNAEKAFNSLGRVYYRVKRYNDAIDAYKEAIKRFPDFHLPYYGLALCYNAMGQYGDAATAITRAIELDPLYKGNREKAIEDFKNKKLMAKGEEEKDIIDYIETLKY
ncbi:MAG: tetratricopeptide repeat protein, partial [Nitrospirota bacterium]